MAGPRAAPGRLTTTVTLSVAGHVGLACVAALVIASRPAPRQAVRSFLASVVTLEEPPPPLPLPVERPAAMAPSAVAATAPQAAPRAIAPRPTASVAPAPSPVLAAPEATGPAVTAVEAPAAPAPVVTTPSAPAAAGPPPAAEGPPAAAAPGPMMDVGEYLARLSDRVSRHRRYPEMAIQLGMEGDVEVAVLLRPDGALAAAPTVAESSGHDLLDEEALRIVQRASPFPPLTGHREPVRLRVPVHFHLD